MYNLCCISNELKEQGYKFQTMTFKRWTQLCDKLGDERALFELGQRWLNNLEVTRLCIEHCHDNCWGYRVSSSLFPCLTHPEFEYSVQNVPQYEQIMEEFRDIVYYNETWQVRLSTHPSQFVVLASENQDAVDKSIAELNHHGWVMDQLGCQRNYYNPINIHVNNTKGDLADIAARFMSNLNKCDQSVQSRLVVENEDRGCWTVANLLEHFDIPITYDNLHDKCNPDEYLDDAAYKCARTWGKFKPLFHYSEAMPDHKNPRKHADMPTDYPFSDEFDWDVEIKGKDFAIRRCEEIRNAQQSEKNKVEHEEQMRTKLENFKDNHERHVEGDYVMVPTYDIGASIDWLCESPEFDNPHAWTQEEMDLMYARISGELNAAWSIKLMALAHHMKKGPYTEGEYEGTARIADPRYREDRSY